LPIGFQILSQVEAKGAKFVEEVINQLVTEG
jgi:hypothetical protein